MYIQNGSLSCNTRVGFMKYKYYNPNNANFFPLVFHFNKKTKTKNLLKFDDFWLSRLSVLYGQEQMRNKNWSAADFVINVQSYYDNKKWFDSCFGSQTFHVWGICYKIIASIVLFCESRLTFPTCCALDLSVIFVLFTPIRHDFFFSFLFFLASLKQGTMCLEVL